MARALKLLCYFVLNPIEIYLNVHVGCSFPFQAIFSSYCSEEIFMEIQLETFQRQQVASSKLSSTPLNWLCSEYILMELQVETKKWQDIAGNHLIEMHLQTHQRLMARSLGWTIARPLKLCAKCGAEFGGNGGIQYLRWSHVFKKCHTCCDGDTAQKKATGSSGLRKRQVRKLL